MGVLVTTHQATFLGMSLALAILVYGLFQIAEGVWLAVEMWYVENHRLQVAARTVAIISMVDGVTGISAVASKSVSLALASKSE